MIKKQHFLSRWKERGNIFFTLFAAVGVVGALGVGSTTLLKGPVQTMVKINQKQVTEEYAELGLRVMMMTVLNNDANCDDDNKLEAAEWDDPTLPDTAPTGGGVFPSTYGTKVTDPWGRRLGYCVWDHGSLIDDAGCGGGTQKRLRGVPNTINQAITNMDLEPFITVISAGPNQSFETSCNDFIDLNTDDEPDTELLIKPSGSDDLIVNYSTIDAQQAMGDNWVFTSNETADGDAATTDQNLDFAQDVTFSGLLDLNKLGGGLTLPDFSSAACSVGDTDTHGLMYRDSATTPPAVMICDGGTWKAMSGGSGATENYAYNFDPEVANCTLNNGGPFVEVGSFDTPIDAYDVWGDGTYIYVADNTSGIRAYTFNGTAFMEAGFFDTPGSAHSIWDDGTYIYVADNTSGIRAYTFNGTTFTEEGFFNTPGHARNIWGDGTYIYVADKASGIRAYTFNGTTFTEEGFFDTADVAFDVWGDGTYIYVTDNATGIYAFTFDGTTFTQAGLFDTPGTAIHVTGDGTYIYVADQTSGVRAYTFDGTTFTEISSFDTPGNAWNIWIDGTHIYIADSSVGGVRAYTFDGTTFTEIDDFDTPDRVIGVWGDGKYIYVADGLSGIRAYSGFECLSTTPDYSDRPDAPNTGVDYNYRSYGWGADDFGEIGNGATTGDQVSPTLVLENNEFYKVSTYRDTACGLKTDGSAWCWGLDTNSELGNGPDITAAQETPFPVSGNLKFIDIGVGRYHGCSLKENGTIWCWGSDVHGQLGDGGGIGGTSDVPVQVSGVSDFIALSSSQLQSCGLRQNGEAWCWGDNDYGQLGNGNFDTDQGAPVKVQTSIPFVAISGHYQTTCGLTESGSVWCWGDNSNGEIGNGIIGGEYNLPVKVKNITDFTSISIGTSSCGLRENGEAWCWGRDNNGELGNGASLTADQPTPTKVADISDFIQIESGAFMTCGIRSNGKAYCWGRDDNGQLGNGAGLTGDQNVPTLVENLDNVVDISCFNIICIAATKTPKQAPDTTPIAPVIIEQKTSAGNTAGSHGLAINYNSIAGGARAGLAFKIDAEDTSDGDDAAASITSKSLTANPGVRIALNDGTSVRPIFKIHNTGSVNIVPTTIGVMSSPKLVINDGALATWNDSRFDTGLLVRNSAIDNPAFYGVDATTGNAVILSGEDLLIQHTATNGTGVTTIASFENAGVPEFYGDMILQKNDGTATVSAYTDTADETAAFKFLRYRGDSGSEAAVQSPDMSGTINFKGFDGTDYDANNTIRIASRTNGTVAAGNVPHRIDIIREDGSASGERILTLGSGGNTRIADSAIFASNPQLSVDGHTTADNAVKAGNDSTCVAIADDDGTLRFTGTEYQYCDGTTNTWTSLVDRSCQDDAKIIDIALSLVQTCIIYSNGQAACWGDNDYGEVGTGTVDNPELDIIPMAAFKAKQISMAGGFGCAITDKDSVKCWGRGENYRLGNGTTTYIPYPTSVASNKTYKKVALGDNFACAIQTNGLVDCWGVNGLGQSGLGDTTNRKVPTTNPYLSNIVDLNAAKQHMCALQSNGSVWCWGENTEAQLGIGTTSAYETTPQNITLDSSLNVFDNVVQISSGGRDETGLKLEGTCALKRDGTVWCWGDNEYGQIGNGTMSSTPTNRPTQVSGITNAVHIARAGGTTCATLDDGTIECWGRGLSGEIGNGSSSNQSTSQTVSGITNAVKTASGQTSLHACAVLQDGSAKCWGSQTSGILGNGVTSGESNTPVDLISPLSCAADKYVFVTSNTFQGDLGGLKGADNICQAHADRANLPGRYLAWLSDDTGSPATRFNRALTDYKLVDGTVVANGWLDLTDGTLDNTIEKDQNGVFRLNSAAWTNTLEDGTKEDNINNCNNWSTNAAAGIARGNLGNNSSVSQLWTNNITNTGCNSTTQRLYCFQQ